MYEVIKTVNGSEHRIYKTNNKAEAEYLVTAMRYNGIESAAYRRVAI